MTVGVFFVFTLQYKAIKNNFTLRLLYNKGSGEKNPPPSRLHSYWLILSQYNKQNNKNVNVILGTRLVAYSHTLAKITKIKNYKNKTIKENCHVIVPQSSLTSYQSLLLSLPLLPFCLLLSPLLSSLLVPCPWPTHLLTFRHLQIIIIFKATA